MTPATTDRPTLGALADATPASRDRYLDLLRAVSIAVVALGHWLLAIVTLGPDGALQGGNALVEVPALHRLTWVFQVMPLFFLVGGVVNARSYRGARRRGTGDAAWIRGRLERLVRPTAAFVVAWSAIALVAATAGVQPDALRMGAHVVAVPLWFLAVYVPVVALTPVMLDLHERHGLGVVVSLVAAAAAVDALHGAGLPLVGWTNFLWVWLLPQQLGFLWADRHPLTSAARGPAVAAAALASLVLLTTVGGYPVSLVGVDGAARSNNAPPSLALVALTFVQLGLATSLRATISPWLERRRVWLAVIALNARAMSLYLWHLSAMIVVALTLVPAGFLSGHEPGTASWWLTRPLWLATLAVVLVPILAIVGRAERLPGRDDTATRALPVAVAVVGCAAAAALLATRGFHVPGAVLGMNVGALVSGAVGVAALRRAADPTG